MFTAFLVFSIGAPPTPDELARAAVAVEISKLSLKPAPVVVPPAPVAPAEPVAPQAGTCANGSCAAPAMYYAPSRRALLPWRR